MAIFRTQIQGDILARVLLADEPLTIADLARELGAPLSTVAREVNRLGDAGILRIVRQGRGSLVSGNEANPALAPLRDLVAVAFGPRFVVAEEFAGMDGLAELVVFGSWAARYRGERGPVPVDVDVLVVGTIDRTAVYDAADRAAHRLHREVNPTVMSVQRWTMPDETADPVVRALRGRPLVRLYPPVTDTANDVDERGVVNDR